MNKVNLVAFWLLIVSVVSHAASLRSKDLSNAMRYGADAKIVLRVVDDLGSPIQDARVGAGFTMNSRNKSTPTVVEHTNKDGVCVLQGKCVGEITYSVRKENHYDTRGRFWLAGTVKKHGEVKDGKWQPYGELHEIILRPKKNPVKVDWSIFRKRIPLQKIGIGFDIAKNDFVAPYGCGKVSDFILSYYENESLKLPYCHVSVVLKFPNAMDGFYCLKKNMYSDFQTDYSVNTNTVFKKELVSEYKYLPGDKEKVVTQLLGTHYLIMRTRTKVDEKGGLKEAYYSVLSGPLKMGFERVGFAVVMNPVLNDINIEFQ